MRKYKPGEVITDINEVLKQDFIYHHHKIYHKGWFLSWSVYYLLGQLQLGRLRYAIKNVEEVTK
jgi:hypothetical protein